MTCHKIRHATAGAAWAHVRAMRADGLIVKRPRVYPCWACGGWHVGYRIVSDGQIRISELLRRHTEDPA
jgi:hypothetical protein